MNRFVAIPWADDIENWPGGRWHVVGVLRRIAHQNAVRSSPILVTKTELEAMAGRGVGRAKLSSWIEAASIKLVGCGKKGFIPQALDQPNAKENAKAARKTESPKPERKEHESSIGGLVAEFEAIYQPVEGSNWFKSRPKGGSHWTPAHRKAVAKRLEDKQCLARLDWERFMAATKNFLFQVKRGDYPANRMYEPPYWIHKARKGESAQPDDTWLEYIPSEAVAPTRPVKDCPRCKGSGLTTVPNPNPNAIGFIRVKCTECNHAGQ